MVYRAVFHFDAHDTNLLTLGLNNVNNLLKALGENHYEGHYDVVMLFNGPAVQLLRRVQCPEQDRVLELQRRRVAFKVCRNALGAFGLAEEEVVAGCVVVPAGIVELITLQHDGYAYIKP